ncbi:MAG: Nif11-like leader peptide family natural product precursor, partial [Cyanobacteria bacterium P01_H01_bin.15]
AIPAVGKDSILQVVRFMEKSASDDSLRQQLQIIIGGDGDVSSPGSLDAEEAQALKGKRGGQVAQVAAQRGFNFSVADLSAVVGAFQLVQSGQLSEAGCVRILGLSGSKYANAGKLPSLNSTVNMVYRGIGYQS